MSANKWNSLSTVRKAFAASRDALQPLFDYANAKHVATLLQLTSDERRALLAAQPRDKLLFIDKVHGAATELAQRKHWQDAFALFDDITSSPKLTATSANNPLWAIQVDNNKLPPQPARVAAYLAACVPHGANNPGVYFNAACLEMERDNHKAALGYIRDALAAGYQNKEQLRDENLFAPLHGEPDFLALFADVAPPKWNDVALAAKTPLRVRNLELECDEFPASVRKMKNLEVLSIEFCKLNQLPAWLAELPLQRLELFSVPIKSLPDDVLTMPTLRHLKLYNTKLPKQYAHIDTLFAGFAKSNTPAATRLAHIALLLDDDKLIQARAIGTAELLDALASNATAVRASAMKRLAKALAATKVTIATGRNVVLLGSMLAERDILKERLTAVGMAIAKAPNAQTAAVVVGENAKGASEYYRAGHTIALEATLTRALDAVKPGHLADKDPTPSVRAKAKGKPAKPSERTPSARSDIAGNVAELLRSDDNGNVKLAIEMMKRGGVPAGICEELFLAQQNDKLDKKTREDAKKLLQQSAPVVAEAAKTVFARTSIFASGETKVRSRLRNFEKAADGQIDALKLARLMLLNRRGFSYFFAESVRRKDPALAAEAIAALRKGTSLDLSRSELASLPPALARVTDLTALNLSGSHLQEVPKEVWALVNLRELQCSYAVLRSIPTDIANLTKLRSLDISSNYFAEFPVAVTTLTSLVELDVSTERWGRARPITSLPDEIGALVNLEKLRLSAHHFTSLPTGLRRLTKLRSLDLSNGKLGELPSWLTDLPALAELDLEHCEFVAKSNHLAVVKALRAKGVKVTL